MIPETSSIQSLAVGCVADNVPKYLDQALRLLQSWRWFGGALASADFHVCVVEGVDAGYRQMYERYGATVHVVPRFSQNHPPSNKLRFLELMKNGDADRVVLLDCDTIIVQEPLRLLAETDFVAKIADMPTVPPDVFMNLFREFGLALPPADQHCTVMGESIIPYFNAGVLSFSRQAMKSLVPEWIRINRLLVERMHLLGGCGNFCEQASLSLALSACGTFFTVLGNDMNFPAHFLDQPAESDFARIDPVIVHYHWLTDSLGYLTASLYPRVDARIRQFNERLKAERNLPFDNQAFWNERYRSNADLGSGLGSRGPVIPYKRAIIARLLNTVNPATILDVGCGDMSVSGMLPAGGYTGVDISDLVIRENNKCFPGRRFIHGDLVRLDLAPADLLVCFDVTIHLSDAGHYKDFVARCLALSGKAGLIAGYEEPPRQPSDITFFHEPLSETLRAAGATNLQRVGAYRQVAVFRFEPAGSSEPCTAKVSHELERPIFLVGTMRSGTTLLAELLGQSPHVAHCPFELKDVWSRAGGIPMASAKTRDMECHEYDAGDVHPEMKKRLVTAFMERMQALRGKAPDAVFLNKNPHLCNKLPLVHALFPDARFIWVHRHLPQVVASLKRLFADVQGRQSTWHRWPEPEPGARNRCWRAFFEAPLPDGVTDDRVFPGGNIRYLAEYWLESNRAVAEFFASLPAGEGLIIAEEALVASPDNERARCLGHLGIPLAISDETGHIIDASRNTHWKMQLTPMEMTELRAFIAARGDEIDAVFPGEERRAFYLGELDRKA
jgi:SAM-dependent methyltransferase